MKKYNINADNILSDETIDCIASFYYLDLLKDKSNKGEFVLPIPYEILSLRKRKEYRETVKGVITTVINIADLINKESENEEQNMQEKNVDASQKS